MASRLEGQASRSIRQLGSGATPMPKVSETVLKPLKPAQKPHRGTYLLWFAAIDWCVSSRMC